MKKLFKNTRTLDELLDLKYGKRGSKKRGEWEKAFEAFRHEVMGEENEMHPKSSGKGLAMKRATKRR